jgi:hypothetical protein
VNSHLAFLVNTFYAVAAAVGIPSLAVTLLYVYYRVQARMTPCPSPSSFERVKNPDGILLILDGMTRSIGVFASVLGFLGKFVFGGLALVAVVILLFAIALFFTGRGLHAHQSWARIVAGLLMAGLLLAALLGLLSFRGPSLLFSVVVAAGSLYALWALWHGFAI